MIRTTVVGSWPYPRALKPQLTAFYKGDLSDEEAYESLQAAARIAMDEQLACGLDQISGGEVFQPDFVHHIPPRLAGLKTIRKRDHRAGYEGVGIYETEGDVSAPRGTGQAQAYRREKAVAPELVMATIPSPITIGGSWARGGPGGDQMENVARIVEAEVLDMADAGAGEIQLDAPSEAIAMINGSRPLEEIVPWLVYPFRAVSGVRRNAHFCLGDMGRRPATQEQNLRSLLPLLQALEGQLDRVHIECSYAGQWDEIGLLADVPQSMEIVAGIADVKSDPQSTEVLRERIEALLEVVPAERLLVSSSCGCGRCQPDQAKELMSNLVEAAHSLG